MKIYLYDLKKELSDIRISFPLDAQSNVLVWDAPNQSWKERKYDYVELKNSPGLDNLFSGPSLSDELFLKQFNSLDLNKDMIIYISGPIKAFNTQEEDEYEYVFQYGLVAFDPFEIRNLECFNSVEDALLSVDVEFQECTREDFFGNISDDLLKFSWQNNMRIVTPTANTTSTITFTQHYITKVGFPNIKI